MEKRKRPRSKTEMVETPPPKATGKNPRKGRCVRTAPEASGGLKYDNGKPPVDLVDGRAILELARVLGFGAQKYAPNNWRKGLAFSRLIAAIERHTIAIKLREDKDPETGLFAAAHLMCEVMFLLHFQITNRTDLDDRPEHP